MLSSSSSSIHPASAPHPFFNSNHDLTDLLRSIFLYTSHPPEDLSVLCRQSSEAVKHPAYWRQLLIRDFDMPPHYWNAMIPAHQDPTATLKVIYQRLVHLKKQHPETYQHYKDVIIDRGIHFLPLYAMGPVYPVIDAAERSFYLIEAMRLKNIGLAQHILLQMFPEKYDEEKQTEWFFNLSDAIFDIAAEMATKTTQRSSKEEAADVDNQTLLRRMRPYLDNDRIRVADSILSNTKISPSDKQATENLNILIQRGRLSVAIKMLQRGAAPNEESMEYFSRILNHSDSDNFLFELIKLAPQYPQLLNVSSLQYFCRSLIDVLREKADTALIEAIYNAAKQFPQIYNSNRFAEIRRCLLESAVIHGNLSALQTYEKNTRKKVAKDIIGFAIQHGQLAILQHFIGQVDKATLICSDRITRAIMLCSHLHIVKYLIEEVKLLDLKSSQSAVGYLLEVWQSIKHRKHKVVEKCLSGLRRSWLESAVIHGKHVDILEYLIYQAPEHCRLTPTSNILTYAVDEAVARYLIERCGIRPQKHQLYKSYHFERNPVLGTYLLSQFLDNMESLVSEDILWNVVSRRQKPNDTANKILDWFMGPEGKKRAVNREYLESHFLLHAKSYQSHTIGIPMLAWFAAKLKIEFSKESMDARAKSVFENCICDRGSWYMTIAGASNWKKMYLEAFDFYYQKYQQDLRSVEASSSAVILRAVTKDNVVEEKSHALNQASSAFSFDVDELPSQPETTVEVLEAARMHYRR
jgi:hypothetical protein